MWYHWSLAIAALGTAIFAVRLGLRRSVLWIAAMAADYILSVGYLYMPKPYIVGGWWPPSSGIAALCDASMCILIYIFGRYRWETAGLYTLMLLSVATNCLYTSGQIIGFPPIPPQDTYGIILEVINYLALLLIFGTAILSRIGAEHGARSDIFGGSMGALHRARQALFAAHEPVNAIRKKR